MKRRNRAAQLAKEPLEGRHDRPAARGDEVFDLQVHARVGLAGQPAVRAQAEAADAECGGVANLGGRAAVEFLALQVGDEKRARGDRFGVAAADLRPQLPSAPRAPRRTDLLGTREIPGVDRLDDGAQARQVDLTEQTCAVVGEAKRACQIAARALDRAMIPRARRATTRA